MAHGTPDFFGLSPKNYTYALQDDAELAARLGSIVNFDRRGEVIFMSAFENGFGDFSHVSEDGVGVSYWYLTGGYNRPTCIGIRPDQATNSKSYLIRRSFIPPQGNYGIEIAIKNITYCRPFFMQYSVYNESIEHRFEVRYNAFLGDITYLDQNGNFSLLGEMAEGWYYPSGYSVLKLVINSASMSYSRFIFNHRTFVFSDGYPYTTSTALSSGTALSFGDAYGNQSTDVYFFIGHVIITQNEPI